MKIPKVIVIGAGFAGVQFIENLDENLFEVLLLDKLNHHQFQPLFYQVATSQIEPSSISFPLRKIFQNRKNIQIRLAEVQKIESEEQTVVTNIGSFTYDYLVIATGCKTNFFGNKEIKKNAFGLKTTFDAIKLRNHILYNFERAISATDDEKESLLNIVIVGGGPTGVELAGAFSEIKKNILPKDYPLINFDNLRIILLEGSKHTLNNMSEAAKTNSEKYLVDMGVEVLTGTIVKNYDGKTISLNNGDTIKTNSLIWAAGVTGNMIDGIPLENTVNNRIKVNRHNLAFGSTTIYALGDIAYMETPNYPKGHPQVANVAINQAKNLAKDMKAMLANQPLKEYEYQNLGSMATIGKNKAVVDLPGFEFKGIFAWIVWMFLHLMLILSVRNKLIIFINWAWNYFTKDTSLRLILKENKASETN